MEIEQKNPSQLSHHPLDILQQIPPFGICTQNRTRVNLFPRIPHQPIPRGLMAHTTGRSSDLSVIASFAFPGIRLPGLSARPYSLAHHLPGAGSSSGIHPRFRGGLKHDSSLTATRSYRSCTCFPFHRTKGHSSLSGTCHVSIHLSLYFSTPSSIMQYLNLSIFKPIFKPIN